MTQPRRHIAGQVTLLTRRCTRGQYFLRPDEVINDIIPYEVAKAAQRHDQSIHAAVAMSNHIHQVSMDTTGDRSRYMRDALSGIARARNRNLDRRGHFWASGSYGDTVLLDRKTVERKLLYTWLNPVEAGLVESAEDWPGFTILPDDWGKTIRIEKPDEFYGRKSPEVVEFTPQPPPGYDEMSLQELKAHFNALLRQKEREIRRRRRREDKTSFLGEQAILEISPFQQPEKDLVGGTLNPRFASKDAELLDRAQNLHHQFLDNYESKRQRWLLGDEDERPIFPTGTVQLTRCAPLECRPPDSDEPGVFAAR